MGVATVPLSAPELRALDGIEEGVASAYPDLAERLTAFSRMAAHEAMPSRERVSAGEPSVLGLLRPVTRSRELARSLLLWLVMAVAVVGASSIALAASHGASRACGHSFALACTQRATAHRPGPAAHSPGLGAAGSRGGPHGQDATAARP